jgi:NADP-dependent aldehyde dehydrogenase
LISPTATFLKEVHLPLHGVSLIGFETGAHNGAAFHGIDPSTGETLEPSYFTASSDDIGRAVNLADEAFPIYSNLSGAARGQLLRTVAANLEANADELVDRSRRESGLTETRLRGELSRTANQMRLFAALVEEGSWVDARIDPALPDRKPAPRPDIRSMLKPLGPVAVFGASNFPLAFSVAGGDTASALAAGNPVVVKAHPAHPGTSELAGVAIREAVRACGLPEGVFSLLFDAGIDVGSRLVAHPVIKAVGFTGSLAGGRALMKLAAARPVPIPVYAEMGSTNPVFVLPGAMRSRAAAISAGLLNSFTLGAGQMCTKPGLVFVPPVAESESFSAELRESVLKMEPQTLLTQGIAEKYASTLGARANEVDLVLAAQSKSSEGPVSIQPVALFRSNVASLLSNPALAEEVFGPNTLLLNYSTPEELLAVARSLKGHLTATVHGTEEDLAEHRELIGILESKVGRLIFNGFPTGVELCDAMVHGGPWPATSDGRSTSVGSQAIFRFARPFCYQGFPDSALPDELKSANPLGILRRINGTSTRTAIS